MTMNNESYQISARNTLIEDEGYRAKPYKDTAGKLTVGVGHNLEGGRKIPDEIVQMVLREAEWPSNAVDALFDYDFACAEIDAKMYYGQDKWGDAPDLIKIALINMAFNLGFTKLCKFTKFLGALQKKNYKAAAAELMNSKAAQQLPKRYTKLKKLVESAANGG